MVLPLTAVTAQPSDTFCDHLSRVNNVVLAFLFKSCRRLTMHMQQTNRILNVLTFQTRAALGH